MWHAVRVQAVRHALMAGDSCEKELDSGMDTFEKKVIDHIRKYNMFDGIGHCVCGVSGGADSVSLLTVLARYRKLLGITLHVVHINHMIRGEEADSDQAYVEELCGGYGIECISRNIDVAGMAADMGLTVEEAGRRARYDTFEQVRSLYEGDGSVIAVAHNQNDVAETVIFNMARGTGLGGMKGIAPVRDNVVRPILNCSRDEIEAYLRRNDISYCTDSTNNEDDYTRNKIRHKVLPVLMEVNEQAVSHICAMAQLAGRYEELTDNMVYSFLKGQGIDVRRSECVWTGGNDAAVSYSIDISECLAQDAMIQELAVRQLIGMTCGGLKDVGRTHVMEVMKLCFADTGAGIDLPGGGRVRAEYGKLVFQSAAARSAVNEKKSQNPETSDAIELDMAADRRYDTPGGTLVVRIYDRPAELDLSKKEYTKYLDYDKINKCLQLRTFRRGDYMIVNSDGGGKKLNRLFTDMKIPADLRQDIPLVADGSEILWAIGFRLGENYKVTEQTTHIAEIQYVIKR